MSIDLSDLFVKPVDGQDGVYSFRSDFTLDAKALGDVEQVVTVQENGDLIIEGYAAVFDGIDRQNENFVPGAFTKGIKSFLNGQATLAYHHKHGMALGKVLELQEEEGKGLKMKARVDGSIQTHPEMGTYYHQIKNGTLNALSVGGFFKRKQTEAGPRIADMDFTEISVTPVPVHPGTNFAVIAGKALADHVEIPDLPDLDGADIRADDARQVNYLISELNDLFARIGTGVAKRGQGTDPNASKVPSY